MGSWVPDVYVMFYTYQEGSGKKEPNEVCNLILKYIKTKIPDEVKELYIFSDACGGKTGTIRW